MANAIFDRADRRVESIKNDIERSTKGAYVQASDIVIGNNYGGSQTGAGSNTGSAMFGSGAAQGIDQSRANKQYESFRNTVATAIRPIMVRFAAQPIRVGYTATRKRLATDKSLEKIWQKAISDVAEKEIRGSAPNWIKSVIGSDVTTMESHPLTDLLASPNEMMTQIGMMQCTAASLALTGRVAWWFDSGGTVREETGTTTRLWYVPWHWLTPKGPKENPYAKWELRSPNGGGTVIIDGIDIFFATVPHPADPTRSWSAVQGQAAAVDTDENILMAQHTSMKNVIRPNLIITAGRIPGMPGSGANKGPRALLDRDQRNKIIEAIKGHYQGVMKYGEPLILDAMIEDVRPLIAGPVELDLVNSSAVTQNRIMQGIGVSPIVAGFSESANRAGSVVAHEIFYELVLNPLIQLFGQALDVMAKRRYGSASIGGKPTLRVWMDEAKPRDVDQVQTRVETCMSAMKFGEVREYLRSGNLILEEKTEKDNEWYVDATAPPVPATQVNPVVGDDAEGKLIKPKLVA